MDLKNDNFQPHSVEMTKLMIDKNEVILTLQKLVDEYPSEVVPRSVVRNVLMKFMGSSALAAVSDHPAVQKLEQTLIKARAVTSS